MVACVSRVPQCLQALCLLSFALFENHYAVQLGFSLACTVDNRVSGMETLFFFQRRLLELSSLVCHSRWISDWAKHRASFLCFNSFLNVLVQCVNNSCKALHSFITIPSVFCIDFCLRWNANFTSSCLPAELFFFVCVSLCHHTLDSALK